MPAPTPSSVERRWRGQGFVPLAALAVWLGFLGLLQLPNDWWSIRLAGMGLDWWYGSLIAPLLIISVILCGAADPATDPLASKEDPSARDLEPSERLR
jgi:hypothetical protein